MKERKDREIKVNTDLGILSVILIIFLLQR